MKRYVPIIIGVVALCAVFYIGTISNDKDKALENEEQMSSLSSKSFQGEVMRSFEGDNVLQYGFDVPETATTSVEKDGALVKVTDDASSSVYVYFSFEGARKYTAKDYITKNIVPNVKAVTDAGTTTIGTHDWHVVESQWTTWHVAPSADGKWLVVVENKKTDAEKANALLETFSTN